MKKTTIIALTCLALGAIVTLAFIKQTRKQNQLVIGILQTASHPALDASREGFMEVVKDKLKDKVTFLVKNAQGSITNAHAIAQQFYNLDVLFGIATPAAQALATQDEVNPIIITAVTDPVGLGLITKDGNVCGVSDMIDIPATVKMIKALVPTAKTVGLIYASGETNSLAMVKTMKQELTQQGLTGVDFALVDQADAQTVMDLACRKSDVVLAPTDHAVAASVQLLSSIALEHKKPFIVSDNMLVQFGPLAARGVDYKACGRQAGHCALQILVEKKTPSEIGVITGSSEQIFLNEKTAEKLGITIPQDLPIKRIN